MNKKPSKNKIPPQKPSTSGDSFFIQPTVAKNLHKERKQEKVNDTFLKKSQRKREPTKSSNKQQQQLKDDSVKSKKPFDKKQWRLKKYSKKYKLEEWESNRKRIIERRYNRELKKQPSFDVQKIYKEAEEEENEETNEEEEMQTDTNKGRKKRMNYKEMIEKIKQDKEKAREEAIKKKQEKKEKLEQYKRKKAEKNRILSKRTKRGQPIMKGRLELLLQQIQETCANN